MKLLEYEAKHLLSLADIQTPKSFIVDVNSPPPFLPAVLKSQVPIGGRGKAGGIAVVHTSEEYALNTSRILSLDIKGFTPKQLLAEELIDIDRELYLSLLIDKQSASIVLMAHTNGGVEIEENNVDDFLRYSLTGKNLLAAGEQLAEYFDLPEKSFVLQDLVKNLYACMIKNDATLLEINPLILTKDGEIVAGDCKMELDDAAAFRHPEWNFEDEAAEVNFVTLDNQGTVATIANGAGRKGGGEFTSTIKDFGV